MRLPAVKFATTALLFALMPTVQAAELTIGQPTSATAMDPGFLKESATLVDNLFDTLVRRADDMSLQPGLATEWKAINETTWQFTLRQDVKFTDGEPVNAEAVKFSLDRILDPANHAPTISYIRTIKSVEVINDYQVQIHTNGPDPLLPTRMSRYPAYIVPPAYVKKVGASEFARKPVGSGAYKLDSFIPDEKVVMVANETYWRGKPAIDRVTWRPIPEATARLTALLTGEVQLIESVPADLVPALKNRPNVELEQVKGGGLTIYLGLKDDEKPLSDVRVRQALSLALNRQAYTQQVASQKQAPMYMLAWGSTQTLDADAALFPILRSGEPYSTVHDAELDKLLDQSRQIVDPVARKKVLEQIQQRVAEQQPLLPLYREDTLYAHSTSLNFKGRVDARIPLFDLRLK